MLQLRKVVLQDVLKYPDTGEILCVSSFALLKKLQHGRAGVPMEVMGLMLGEFAGDFTDEPKWLLSGTIHIQDSVVGYLMLISPNNEVLKRSVIGSCYCFSYRSNTIDQKKGKHLSNLSFIIESLKDISSYYSITISFKLTVKELQMLQSLNTESLAEGLRLNNFEIAAKNNLTNMQEMVKMIKLYNKELCALPKKPRNKKETEGRRKNGNYCQKLTLK